MKTGQSCQPRAFRLQLVLIVPFVLQVFGAVGLVGYLSFRNGQKAVSELADQVMDRTGDVVDEHLKSYLSIPQKLNQINADAIRRGWLDVRDRKAVSQYFLDQMQAYDLTAIGIGLTTGAGTGAIHYTPETITIEDWTARPPNNVTNYATDEQGNRIRVNARYDWNNFSEPWYTEPIAAGRPIWAKIVTLNLPTGPYVAASASRPIYDSQQRLLGMIASDIHLLKLSNFLRGLDISQSGIVFIVERDGLLVANSSPQQPFTVANEQVQRLSATDSPDPKIRAIAQQLQQLKGFEAIRADQELRLTIAGESHYIRVLPWRDNYGLDWLIVVAVPEQEFMAQVNDNTRTTLLLCIGALAVASLLGVLTTRWITRPILRLNQASEAMAAGNFKQAIAQSSIQELDVLSSSFNHMAAQLHESFTALEHSKEALEERVEERTTELKTTLTDLQRTQTQMIQSEKMSSLGQLVAGIAHEINNPVNFIHGNLVHVQQSTEELLNLVHLCQQHDPYLASKIQAEAEDIDLEFLQDDLPKMLASMKIGTDRIRQIVLSLRTFSRTDESEIKSVDIHAGIDSTLMILQHRLKAKSDRAEISVIKDYGALPPVECYAGQLNQVFMNILVNAIDALEEFNAQKIDCNQAPSQITIRTALVDDRWAQIAIADNGFGIPEDAKKRIFDPFFTTKPIGKGTGMGMSISYQIVTEKHNGKLKCFSTLGGGAEFVIEIPILRETPISV